MADDTTPALRMELEGSLAYLIIDNPARLNALTAAMWAALPQRLADAEADANVRVIVLKGAGGKAFSAGADISEFDTARTGNAAHAYDALNHAAFEALLGTTKPTIAMIEGFCLGGGLGIAACCDLRMANDAVRHSGRTPRSWLSSALGADALETRSPGEREGTAVHRAAVQFGRSGKHGPRQPRCRQGPT
jgi:enoyl-CoA hydratase/carnithine racemase